MALGIAWAVYLVPKVLGHHDAVAKNRSVDSFSESLRVLARREPSGRRTSKLVRMDTPRISPPSSGEMRARRLAARDAARRRRLILTVLLFVGFVVTALSLLGVLAQWAPAVPGVAILLFLYLSISLGRRERLAWSLRMAIADDGPVMWSAQQVPLTIPRPVEARNEQGFQEVSATDDTITFDREELERALAGNGVWDPLPMTLPTYVTKPKATRAVRQIDLSSPGTYSSGRDAADSALVAQAGATAQTEAEDDEVESQRAVGS